MRFMLIGKATKSSEAGALPSEELLAETGKFNEELIKAGGLLAAEGRQVSSKGAWAKFAGNEVRFAARGDRIDQVLSQSPAWLGGRDRDSAGVRVEDCSRP
jgi:hypothetical protein